MKKDFRYLEIPASLKPFIGEPDPDTRIYRREGSDEESGPWFDALGEHLPGEGFVSPGGVMMYAPVSRAAVHKRLKEGKMTAFCFHVVEAKRSLFVYQKKLKQLPYVYIPVSECKAWGEELKTRPDRKEAYLEAVGGDKPDREGEFLAEAKRSKSAVAPAELWRDKAAEKVSRAELKQLILEILAEDLPTIMGEKAVQAVAAKAKARLAKRRKNAKRD
jgi:hypothetical protein